MSNLSHLLSSSRSMIVFETAARNRSFTRAAAELRVSQPAVSRQIRELEATIGCRLFHRTGNSVELTRSGELLYAAVTEGLGRISTTMRSISNVWQSSSITIRSHMELMTYFLMPALNGAEALDVNYSLEILTYRRGKPVDFEGPGIAILYGDGNWPGYRADRIFDDSLFPVCSPATFRRLGGSLLGAKDHEEPLLQLDGFLDEMMDWRRWAELFPDEGLGQLPVRHFSDYEVLLQASRTGRGIAMGSICVVAPYLKSGELVRASDRIFRTTYGYYLVYDPLIVEVTRFRRLLALLTRRAMDYSDEIRKVFNTPQDPPADPPFRRSIIEF